MNLKTGAKLSKLSLFAKIIYWQYIFLQALCADFVPQLIIAMKKKSNDMSPDMLTDATLSTPIPVFTTSNEGNENESKNLSKKKTDDF